MKCFRVILILAVAFLWPSLTIGESSNEVGLWSIEAEQLLYTREARKIEIESPDKQKRVIINDLALRVVNGHSTLLSMEYEVESLAELSWAPNSNAFFITESDGGNVGKWYVRIYLIENTKVRKADLVQEVEKDYKGKYRCQEPEDTNIAGIKWLEGSQKLLLVAQVPPHSSCPEMGKLGGYIVSVPSGKIIQAMDQKKLMADWGKYIKVVPP